MLLKTNEQNRTLTAQQDDWESYHSTPEEEDEDEDVQIEEKSKFARVKAD